MISPENPGLKIAEKMFEKYLRLRKLSQSSEIDPKVRKEIKEFLDALDEYLEFIGTQAKEGYEKVRLFEKIITGRVFPTSPL